MRGPTSLFWRALTIAALVAHALGRFSLGWLALLVSLAGRDRRRAFLGTCLADLFRALGATFIKIGQIMSTRPDLLPEHITRALAQLQDDVGPFSFQLVRTILEEDLRQPLALLFDEIAPTPVASASVAQVHKARLRDGRVVAVKVRRPDVVPLCRFDLAVVRFFARGFAMMPGLRPLDPAGAAEEFSRAVFAQLDFRIEADNSRRFRAAFADDPTVFFPAVVEILSTERVLVMQFVEGHKLHLSERAPDGTAARPEDKHLARVGMRTLLKMIFAHGFVHADLHPGNILVTPDGKLALIDLGLVAELDTAHRQSFARFFSAWAMRDGDTMARLLFTMSGEDPATHAGYQRFRAAIIEFVGRYWGRRLGEVQVGRVLLDLMVILRRHRVRMNPAFTTVNIAIAVTEGIGKQLDPELDLMAEALPFFVSLAGQDPAGGHAVG